MIRSRVPKLLVIPVCCAALLAQEKPAADLLITNAKIWTVDAKHPKAEAVAVIGDRIVGVGTAAEIDGWRGQATKMIDARGRLLLPGFNDAHVHITDGGLSLVNPRLKDAATPAELARRIGQRVRIAPGEWIVGGDWDEMRWNPPAPPTKELIDPVTPSTPVLVSRYDGHEALANSVALARAGITAQTPDPPGGIIVRDAQGNPTGLLKESAIDLVQKIIPPLSHQQRLDLVRRVLRYAASLGVTSMQEMANGNEDLGASIGVYAELANSGELTTRIYVAPWIAGWQNQAKLGIHRAFGSPHLRVGAVKAFIDGSLGSSTAYFFQPYTDKPKTRGMLVDEAKPLAKIRERMLGADKAGLQLCVHAIGDEANSIVLDLFEALEKKNGPADRRWRIEHAQHVAPKDFERFARLRVIASVQPYHAIDDGGWVEKRIGHARAQNSYAWRSFLDHGVRLALGTDWDVAALNPLLTIYAAVTRATLDGKHPRGWIPEQRMSVSEAVEAYTMGSAYAEFQENQKGSITAGKLADMILLSDDIFSIEPRAIKDVLVEETIVGGRVVFQKQ